MVIKDTSILTYLNIEEKGFKDSWENKTYEAIKNTPLMTAREYFELIIKGGSREKIFPRITELKKKGRVIEFNKRKCAVGKRLSYTYCTTQYLNKITSNK